MANPDSWELEKLREAMRELVICLVEWCKKIEETIDEKVDRPRAD